MVLFNDRSALTNIHWGRGTRSKVQRVSIWVRHKNQ